MPRCQSSHPTVGASWIKGRGSRGLTVLAAALVMLSACEGDTLYDLPTEPGVPGPGPQPPGTGRGELVSIPGIGVIADMVVDPATQQVFLSNRGQHRLEVLLADELGFGSSVPVGSEPHGLSLSWDRIQNRTGDTLIVANSGGTNISFVHTGSLTEDVERRFSLPRLVLYDYLLTPQGVVLDYHNFSDRPQYVTQDARGRILYSAVPTQANPVGTIRAAELKPGWDGWEAQFLFPTGLVAETPHNTNRAIVADPTGTAVANLDSMHLAFEQDGPVVFPTGEVIMFDHIPGTLPKQVIRSGPASIEDAARQIAALGSDVLIYPGHVWNVPEANEVADTTFVAVSGDRRWVAFGELSQEAAGRIAMWSMADSSLSRVEDIYDILNNSSDQVLGIELNENGTLGVARGSQSTYFFGNDLRLQGLTAASQAGGRGAGLLPGSVGNRTYALEPTGAGTLRIIETTHYTVITEIPVREAIAGPFRVGPPRAGVTACPAELADGPDDCIAATVYGVTTGRHLLVLDVRRDDIIP
jgi:hypothetical protein